MEHRLKEHKRALTSSDAPFSAVAEHAMQEGHEIAWDDAEVIDTSSRTHQRCCLEAWHIKVKEVFHEQDEGALPAQYNSLIHQERNRYVT